MEPKDTQFISKKHQILLLFWLAGIACIGFFSRLSVQSSPVVQSAFAQAPETGIIGPAVSIFSQNPFLSPLYAGCGGITPPEAANPEYEQQVTDLVNNERASRGLPPLKRVLELDRAARYHAIDMLQDNYFDHDSYDRVSGQLSKVCNWYQRVSSYYSNWMFLAENIAAGYTTPTSVMNGWMNSTGHRENILSDSNWEIGVGYASGGSWGHYWVQDFGKRSGVYPLILNRDAASTTSRQVQVHLYGSFAQMRLKNDNETFGNWQAFQNAFTWITACGVGTHTVTAEVKTGSGTAYTSSDAIQLTVSGCPRLGGMPDQISFLYSKSEGQLYPPIISIIPANTVSHETISWSLSKTGSWFNVTPLTGSTPDAFQVIPTGVNTLPSGVHLGSITVTATAPSTTEDTPKIINARLIVLEGPPEKNYFPITLR